MPKRSAKTASPAIRVEKLTVTLNNVTILRDVTFNVPSASLTAIVGANGSGKTTLVRAMLGLTPITQGNVTFFNKRIAQIRAHIGYVPQRFDFDRDMPITAEEFLSLARRPETPRKHLLHTLKEVGLPATVLRKRIGTLSGGQLQRLLIAQAILNNPTILILDEPATGIDEQGEETIMHVLEHLRDAHGTTIVMITHDLAMVAQHATHVIRM